MASRPRGSFFAPTSRTGQGFTFAGQRVRVGGSSFQYVWLGQNVERLAADAVAATFQTLKARGQAFIRRIVPVDTGELQASTFVDIVAEGGRAALLIGATAAHAIYVELGTSKMRAQPYIRPTFDFLARELPRVLQAEVSARARGF